MTPNEFGPWIVWAPAVLSMGAAGISAFYAWRSHNAKREANRISQEMLELQRQARHDEAARQRRTRWAATVEDTKSRRILTIECLGPAEARDVTVTIDGKQAANWGTSESRPATLFS